MKKLFIAVLFLFLTFNLFSQTFKVYPPDSKGSYGFSDWQYTESKHIPGFLEYIPDGSGKNLVCIIDIHGIGFKSSLANNLDEGLAWWIRKLIAQNKLFKNPLTDTEYMAIMPAGGKWLSTEEIANLIAYAHDHPRVKKIVLSGLSGGAMSSLRFIGTTKMKNYVEHVSGVIAYSGSMFRGYDKNQVREIPILIHHGATDGTRRASNVAALKKEVNGDNIILNIFSGIGHSSKIWHGAYTDRNENVALIDMVIARQEIKSDPYMSIWEFLKLIEENDDGIDVVNPPVTNIEIYLNGQKHGEGIYGIPYELNSNTTITIWPKTQQQ